MGPIKYLILDTLIIHAQRDPDVVNNTCQTELRIGFDQIDLFLLLVCDQLPVSFPALIGKRYQEPEYSIVSR